MIHVIVESLTGRKAYLETKKIDQSSNPQFSSSPPCLPSLSDSPSHVSAPPSLQKATPLRQKPRSASRVRARTPPRPARLPILAGTRKSPGTRPAPDPSKASRAPLLAGFRFPDVKNEQRPSLSCNFNPQSIPIAMFYQATYQIQAKYIHA